MWGTTLSAAIGASMISGSRSASFKPSDLRFHQTLGILRRVVLGVLPDVAVLACDLEALRHPLASDGHQLLELGLEPLVGLERE